MIGVSSLSLVEDTHYLFWCCFIEKKERKKKKKILTDKLCWVRSVGVSSSFSEEFDTVAIFDLLETEKIK